MEDDAGFTCPIACQGAFKYSLSEKKREGTSVKKNKTDRVRKSMCVGV